MIRLTNSLIQANVCLCQLNSILFTLKGLFCVKKRPLTSHELALYTSRSKIKLIVLIQLLVRKFISTQPTH
jgi:hypothetical protein